MPLGALLDQWEVYRQFHGLSDCKNKQFIDNMIDLCL
jgi:hypothetical protein